MKKLILLGIVFLISLVSVFAVSDSDIYPNLVLQASGDNASQHEQDTSVLANNGADTGTDRWTDTNCKIGAGCWEFVDNTADWVAFPDNAAYDFGANGQYLVSCWISMDDSNDPQQFIDRNGKIDPWWGVWTMAATLDAGAFTYDNTNYINGGTVSWLKVGQWSMVTGVYNGTDALIYINDTLSNSVTHTANVDSAGAIYLGQRRQTVDEKEYDGTLDQCIVMNISHTPTISTQEIIDYIYNSGDARVISAPVAAPPVISDVCSTSPDPDDCTEPYNTGGDLTPTFNFTTDVDATCYIGDDNATWTVCSTTTVAGEHICTEPATHPLVFGADKVYLNCSGTDGDTYDELNVISTYLSGNVTDNSYRLISGALVTVSKNNTPTIWDSNVTDVNGYWAIGAEIGFYTICAYDPDNITLRGDCTPFVEVD